MLGGLCESVNVGVHDWLSCQSLMQFFWISGFVLKHQWGFSSSHVTTPQWGFSSSHVTTPLFTQQTVSWKKNLPAGVRSLINEKSTSVYKSMRFYTECGLTLIGTILKLCRRSDCFLTVWRIPGWHAVEEILQNSKQTLFCAHWLSTAVKFSETCDRHKPVVEGPPRCYVLRRRIAESAQWNLCWLHWYSRHGHVREIAIGQFD